MTMRLKLSDCRVIYVVSVDADNDDDAAAVAAAGSDDDDDEEE